jgi:hypothetical protein
MLNVVIQSVIILIVVAPKECECSCPDKSSEQADCDKIATVHGQTWAETDRQTEKTDRETDRQSVIQTMNRWIEGRER